MKVVINSCYGGFELSSECLEALIARGWALAEYDGDESLINPNKDSQRLRAHPDLVELVELLGDRASSRVSRLKVVEIPDGVKWHIEEYDGKEWVAEDHRIWD